MATRDIARQAIRAAEGTATVSSNITQVDNASRHGHAVASQALEGARAMQRHSAQLDEDVRLFVASLN